MAGLGLIQVPRYHVECDLADGSLCEVLPDWPPPALPLRVLYPLQRQLSPRVRVFVEICSVIRMISETLEINYRVT